MTGARKTRGDDGGRCGSDTGGGTGTAVGSNGGDGGGESSDDDGGVRLPSEVEAATADAVVGAEGSILAAIPAA